MKTKIYFFSGTGNSLWFAEKIAEGIPSSSVESIASLIHLDTIECDADVIGLVYPIYYWGLPEMVDNFIKKLQLRNDSYIFAAVTCGGPPALEGGGTVAVEEAFRSKGQSTDSVFLTWMPGNFISAYGAFPDFLQKKLIKKAEKKAKFISKKVNQKRSHFQWGNPITNLLSKKVYIKWRNGLKDNYKLFTVDESCNTCGVCIKTCPASNLSMEDGRPNWKAECQECYACIQYCPKESIQFKGVTKKRKRYHHPQVSAAYLRKRNIKKIDSTHSIETMG